MPAPHLKNNMNYFAIILHIAIKLAEDLEHRLNRTPEEDILLELLVTLIEKFEENHFPIPEGTPHSMLMHLIDARDITPEALVQVLGSWDIVQGILNGDIIITQTQAVALGDYFRVDPNLFR